jgi:hypothetical protein
MKDLYCIENFSLNRLNAQEKVKVLKYGKNSVTVMLKNGKIIARPRGLFLKKYRIWDLKNGRPYNSNPFKKPPKWVGYRN